MVPLAPVNMNMVPVESRQRKGHHATVYAEQTRGPPKQV